MSVKLERYSVKERIGEGGFGDVYKAVQNELERTVALKTLRLDLASKPAYVSNFQYQARLGARLEHQNIVRVYDSGCENGIYYVSMQYIKGHTLFDLLLKRGPFAPSEVVSVARQVADALDYAHKRDVVHADLNPGNIMITGDSTAYVMDFRGAGRPLVGERVVGVPEYVSPEQARGDDASPASDVYSLGIILYHMITGRPPFSEAEPYDTLNLHISAKVPEMRSPVHKVPDRLAELVMSMLSRTPEERPSPAEIRDELAALSSSIKPIKKKAKNAPVPMSLGKKIAAMMIVPVGAACYVVAVMLIQSLRLERDIETYVSTHASVIAKEQADVQKKKRREFEYDREMSIGQNHYKARQYGLAEEAFRRASHLKPRSTDPRMFLAAVYVERGEYNKAAWHLRRILQIQPGKREAIEALQFISSRTQPSPVELRR